MILDDLLNLPIGKSINVTHDLLADVTIVGVQRLKDFGPGRWKRVGSRNRRISFGMQAYADSPWIYFQLSQPRTKRRCEALAPQPRRVVP